MNNKYSNLKILVTFINYREEIYNCFNILNESETSISNYIKENLFVMKMIKNIEEKNQVFILIQM